MVMKRRKIASSAARICSEPQSRPRDGCRMAQNRAIRQSHDRQMKSPSGGPWPRPGEAKKDVLCQILTWIWPPNTASLGAIGVPASPRHLPVQISGIAVPTEPVRCGRKHRTDSVFLFDRVIHVAGESACDDHALGGRIGPMKK